MYTLALIIHVIVCFFLIIVVLLQSGKAADLAGAFGGMGSQTAFGPRGSATLLSKATTISAIVFMITSLALSVLASKNAGLSTTVLESTPNVPVKSQPAPAQVPAVPQPNNATPSGGITPTQVPTPQGQQSAPAPAQPAAPAAPAKK